MLTHQSREWAVVRVSNDVSDQALKVAVTQTVVYTNGRRSRNRPCPAKMYGFNVYASQNWNKIRYCLSLLRNDGAYRPGESRNIE